MKKEEKAKVVRRLCSKMTDLPAKDIPPLALQLLNLTKSENAMVFFLALSEYFNRNLYESKPFNATIQSISSSSNSGRYFP